MISEPYEWWGGKCLQCEICGDAARRWDLAEGAPATDARNGRCEKHLERNPCAIEGCKRSTSATMLDGTPAFRNDQWLCQEHWRRFVPPHSPMRRAYHRFFRLAKRHGWTPALRRRFWRFWGGLVAQARRKAAGGDLDMGEINKMFGWED